jgi:hypothetical protein
MGIHGLVGLRSTPMHILVSSGVVRGTGPGCPLLLPCAALLLMYMHCIVEQSQAMLRLLLGLPLQQFNCDVLS